ncbi:MAG: hypothetical protein JRD89_04850 [Deltaproteobacteria bacterium]|nr:hypothetical protein [Deltaproteobacteria bacterium]
MFKLPCRPEVLPKEHRGAGGRRRPSEAWEEPPACHSQPLTTKRSVGGSGWRLDGSAGADDQAERGRKRPRGGAPAAGGSQPPLAKPSEAERSEASRAEK